MPGIVGIIGASPTSEAPGLLLDRMVEAISGEPSYSVGTYRNEELECWVGWRCRKGSFADCLPVWNEARDVCLIFSGETFCDASEIARLKGRGHEYAPGNASYLVHLYEERGSAFLEELNGWFSGVLIDLRSRCAMLFNDRYGFNRIYYYEQGPAVYFASEAKSLLRVAPTTRQLDMPTLAELCACGAGLNNRTIFNGVRLLPGAASWSYLAGKKWRKKSYFDRADWENQSPLTAPEYYSAFKDVFTRILPRYLSGHEKVGVSLTGGLDGRMIMAWAKTPAGTLPCYTFGGEYRDCADVKIARRIAAACQQPHQTIEVGQQCLQEFPALAARTVYLSDGAMDVTGAVELYANRIARQIAPVRLTGNYGSEILRGNVAFKPQPPCPDLFEPAFADMVRQAAHTYSEATRVHPLSFIAFKQVPWHHYSRLSIEQSQLTLRAPYLDNELVALAYRAPKDHFARTASCLRLIVEGNEDLGRVPTDRGVRYRPVPLVTPVQHLYQEFTFRAEYAYDYGMPQWLARIDHRVASLHLERLFLGRHKFSHFRIWYRDQLSSYVRELLLDRRSLSRDYLRKQALERIVLAHTSGLRNHTSEIHRLITLELIYRQLLENKE